MRHVQNTGNNTSSTQGRTGAQAAHATLSRRALVAGGAACTLAGALQLSLPLLAHADELADKLEQYQELAKQIDQMRLDLEKSADEFYKAMIIYSAAEEEVDAVQEKIDTTSLRLARIQARLADRMKVHYKSDGLNLLSVLLDATSFKDFATKLDMLNRLNDADASLASQVRALQDQNKQYRTELDEKKQEALKRLEKAQSIQQEAIVKSAELEELFANVSGDIESIIGADQAAALAAGADVKIIGNPRNIEPHPEVVEFARSRIGCPYVWAAAGPSTFDCSGLVVWVFDRAGIPGLPHYTESLYGLALAVGAVLPLEDVEPGDVLYRPGHVGIAAGRGGLPYIHAPYTGALVRDTDSLAYSRFVCGLRFPGANAMSPEELAAALAAVNAEVIAAELAKEKEEEERAKKEAEEKAKKEKEEKEKKEREAKDKAAQEKEAAAKKKAEEEAKAKAEAEKKAQQEADERARAEAEAKAKAEAEEKARQEAEAKAKAEAEEKARKEAEEKARREAEEKAKAEAEQASASSSESE